MKKSATNYLFLVFFLYLCTLTTTYTFLDAQDFNDCVEAFQVCGDGNLAFDANGGGDIDDLMGLPQPAGCIPWERGSAWYKIQIRAGAPNTTLEFTISPFNNDDDYDFSLFDANAECGNLGSAVRCSNVNNETSPTTGLSNNETDPIDQTNGFAQSITVSAGQTYYLLIVGQDQANNGFTIEWGSDVKANQALDCCVVVSGLNAPQVKEYTTTICQGDSLRLTTINIGDDFPYTYEILDVTNNISLADTEIRISNQDMSSVNYTDSIIIATPNNLAGLWETRIVVTSSTGCKDTLSINTNIERSPDFSQILINGMPPLPTTEICIGESVTIEYADPSLWYEDYVWDFDGASIFTSNTDPMPQSISWDTKELKEIYLNSNCEPTPSPILVYVLDTVALPTISCIPAPSEITFSWTNTDPEVNGHDWDIAPMPVPPAQVMQPTPETVVIMDADPTIEYTISVMPQLPAPPNDDTFCEPSAVTLSCMALSCASVTFDVNGTSSTPYCESETNALPITIISTETSPGSGTLSSTSAGFDVANRTFTPSLAGAGTHTIVYDYENDCQTSFTIEVLPLPPTNFSLNHTSICSNETVSATYNDDPSDLTFEWNYTQEDGSTATNNSPVPAFSWTETGTYEISLTVTNTVTNCMATSTPQMVMVTVEPENLQNLVCGTATTNSVSFNWTANPTIDHYEIEASWGTTTENFSNVAGSENSFMYTHAGLTAGTTVSFTIDLIGYAPCGNLSTTINCTTQNCPTLSPPLDFDLAASYCLDTPAFTLSPTENIYAGGTFYLCDANGMNCTVLANDEFDANAIGLGMQTIKYEYTDAVTACTYEVAPKAFTIQPLPITPTFSPLPNEVCLNQTTTFTTNSTIYVPTWDFDTDAIITPNTPNEDSYDVVWSSLGPKTISLVFRDNLSGCESQPFTHTLNVLPLPDAPTAPTCTPTLTGIELSWPAVSGINQYEVMFSINGNPFTENLTTNSLIINTNDYGFAPEMVNAISGTVASVGGNCGNSTTVNFGPCAPIICNEMARIDLSETTDLCSNDAVITFTFLPPNATITGAMTTGAGTATFTPSINNIGTNSITLNYTDPNTNCSYDDEVSIVIHETPTTNINVSATQICENTSMIVEATNANLNFTYNWNFGNGATPATATTAGPHSVSWAVNSGMNSMPNISLSVQNSNNPNCFINASETIEVVKPLPPPVLTCGSSTTNEVTFTWTDVGANGYEIVGLTIDGVSQGAAIGTNTDNLTSHTINGLSANQEVRLIIKAIGNAPCGNSVDSAELPCSAQDCTPPNVAIIIPVAQLCGGDMPVTLSVSPNNLGGSFYVDGALLTGNALDPDDYAAGTHNITYQYAIDGCDFSTPNTTIDIFKPQASFIIQEGTGDICVGDEITIEYTGTTADNYNWSITDENDSPTTNATFTQSWVTNGSKTIALTTTEGSCSSTAIPLTINVTGELSIPSVTCTDRTQNSVRFTWNDVNGTGDFNYTIIINNDTANPITGTTTQTEFTQNGLMPSDVVEITVEAVGNPPCGNSAVSTVVSCTAENCPNITATIDNVTDGDTFCSSDAAFALTGSPIGGAFTINGNAATQLDPANLGVGTHTITYAYTDGQCDYPISLNVEIFATPTASISSNLSEICLGDMVEISATSTASSAANFDWDFGVDAVATENGGIYTVNWMSAGTKTVALTVTENGCATTAVPIEINVVAPLPTPNVQCGGSSTSSVTFNWDEISPTTEYSIEVFVDAMSVFTNPNTTAETHTQTDLMPNQMVTINVTALGTAPCGDSDLRSIDCPVENCPPALVSIDGDVPTELCVSATNVDLTGKGSPAGGVFSIDGLEITEIVPSNYLPTTYTLIYTYTDGQCDYPISQDLTIHADPVASFSTTDTACINDDQTFTFNGTAEMTAVFTWDFGTDASTPMHTGEFPPPISWATTGKKYVNLLIEQNGCSHNFLDSLIIDEPPVAPTIQCGTTTQNSIEFVWNDLPNVTNYELTIEVNNNASTTEIVNGTSFTQTNLMPNDQVVVTIVAIGMGSCGNSLPSIVPCVAQNCPTVNPTFVNLSTEFCPDDLPITLTADPTGGVFTIDGNVATTFDPAQGAGTYLIEYLYSDGLCTYPALQETVRVVVPPINSFTTNATQVCVNQDVEIEFSGSFGMGTPSLDWDFDDANLIFDQDNTSFIVSWPTAGIKTITSMASESGCVASDFSLSIEVIDSLAQPVIVCSETTENSVILSWNPVHGAEEYNIRATRNQAALPALTTVDTFYQQTNLDAGDTIAIILTITDTSICATNRVVEAFCVARNCPELMVSFDNLATDYCQSDGNVILAATPTGGVFVLGNDTLTQLEPSNLTAGSYDIFYHYTDLQNGCVYSINQEINIHIAPTADFEVDSLACANTSVMVRFTGQTATNNAVWTWDFSGAQIISQNGDTEFELSWNEGGTKPINLMVTENGCMTTATQNAIITTINIATPNPPTIDAGQSVELSVSATSSTSDDASIVFGWQNDASLSCTDCNNPTVTPIQTTTYFVTATDADGCSQTVSILVTVREQPEVFEALIPTAFSPNGDSRNDVFYVMGANITSLEFEVYNRWGSKVFVTSNINEGWDGMYKGSPAPVGRYIYSAMVGFSNGDQEFYEGTFILLR